jgi:potassium large conductance calcium-activated channel subfamily M alpha protein 1
LANDNLGEENIKYDTYIWNEINRFEDIYLITGSALNPEDLEKARVAKAYSIIILAKNHEGANKNDAKVLDAEAIFMYKTIAKQHKQVQIVTELASLSTMSFLVTDKDQQQDTAKEPNYYATKPFAAGEIYVGSLLNSLMCQSYFNEKLLDIIEQMILGSSFVPQEITSVYE